MLGLIVWNIPRGAGREKNVATGERIVLHMRFQEVRILKKPRTPEAVLRRRVGTAAKRLRKLGVTQAVLPADFPYREQLEKQGIRPVSTLALRRSIAAEWVRAALTAGGLPVGGARVAVCAQQLTGEVVRTVTELVLRHRYVLLALPRGGEELCRQLRREYGVSLLLAPSEEQLKGAEAQVLFNPGEDRGNPVTLRLYDEAAPLPVLTLPPALEEQLPEGADRGMLLAALRGAGVLKPGQITVALSTSD